MANKAISELVAADHVTPVDLFVMEQDGTAKKLTGQTLQEWFISLSEAHGGILSFEKYDTTGLKDTYRIVLADRTIFDFVVTNGADGKDGYTPQKGVDYFDGYTPVKGSDYFDGKDGMSATHRWDGTTLTITSASGTSSADLKGEKGDSIKGEPFEYEDFTEEQLTDIAQRTAAIALEVANICYVASAIPASDMGKDGDVCVVKE